MKIKKVFALLLCMIIVLSIPMSVVQAEANLEITGTKVQAQAGETVTVDLVMQGNPGISALNLYYTYNTEYFTLAKVENKVSAFTMTHVKTTVWDAAENYTGNGTLATLTFQVAEETPDGEYEIGIHFLSASNDSFEAVQAKTSAATITIADTKEPELASLKIVSYPDRMDYWEGAGYSWTYWGLKLEGTLSNKEVVDWEYGVGNLLGGHEVVINTEYGDDPRAETKVVITCADKTVSFSVNIVENPVERIEVLGETPTWTENLGGYWSDSDNCYIYYIEVDNDICIYYKDGSSKLTKIGRELNGYQITAVHTQATQPWVPGVEQHFTVTYGGCSVDVPVTIIGNPIESIEVLTAPSRKYVYGDLNYGWIEDGVYSFSDPSDLSGLSFKIHYKGGTNATYTDKDIDGDGCINDQYLRYEVVEEPQGGIGFYTIRCEYMDQEFDYQVQVIESNVASIKVVQDPNKTEYDNQYSVDFLGMKVEITYKDGAKEIVEATEENYFVYFDRGYELITHGNEHIYITGDFINESENPLISYLGAYCIYDGFTYYEGKAIASIQIPHLSMTDDDMIIHIQYEDDTTQTITLKFLDSYFYPQSVIFEGIARTENGLVYCTKEVWEGKSYVYFLDQEYIQSSDVLVNLHGKNTQGEYIQAGIEGQGHYDLGDNVLAVAQEQIGYKFLGWYLAADNENGYEEKPISTELEYTFLAEDRNLIALYEKVGSATLKVNGANFKVNDGVTQMIYNYTQDFNLGEVITLTATGDNFAYWLNESNKIVSTDQTFSFTMYQAIEYTVVYKNAIEGESAYVEFVSDYDQVLQAQNYGPTSKIVMPIAPSKSGHEFVDWSMTPTEIREAIQNGETYIRVTPVYEEIIDYFEVQVVHDGGVRDIYLDIRGYQFYTVYAKEIEGKKFAYWSDAETGGNILGTDDSYAVYVNKNIVLYAIYVDAEEEVEINPTIVMTNAYTSVSNTGAKKVHFEATRNIPDGYTLQEHGALYGTNSAFGESDAEDVMIIGGSGVSKQVSTATGNAGIYVLNVSIGTKVDTVVYARGYMILKNNSTDKIITVYSNIISGSYNSLNV